MIKCYNYTGDKDMIKALINISNDIEDEFAKISVSFANFKDEKILGLMNEIVSKEIENYENLFKNYLSNKESLIKSNEYKMYINNETIENMKHNPLYFFRPNILKLIHEYNINNKELDLQNLGIIDKINSKKNKYESDSIKNLDSFLKYSGFSCSIVDSTELSRKYFSNKTEEEIYSLAQDYIQKKQTKKNSKSANKVEEDSYEM